jgi:hypothetical protein
MNTLHSLSASRVLDAVIFTAVVAFTVVSLVRFHNWLDRGADIARVRPVALLLVVAFYLMAVAGIADFAVTAGRLGVLNLSLFLGGAAGLAILTTLMLTSGRWRELRRIAARDL